MEIPEPNSNNYLKKLKKPPQAVDLEMVVLGALLIDKNAINNIYSILEPKMFYLEKHSKVYSVIKDMFLKDLPIDLKTVSDSLKRKNLLKKIGGDFYLISLMQKVASSAHIEYHTRIIIQKYILRELILLSNKTIQECYDSDPDIFDLMDKHQHVIENLKVEITSDAVNTNDAKSELRERYNAMMKGEAPGVYTFISEFDSFSGGLQPQELIIMAARPGMGKTTVVISITYKLSFLKKQHVAFFSLEMSELDIKNRYASILTGIDFQKIRKCQLSSKEFTEVLNAYDEIDNSNLHLITGMKNYYAIKNKLKKLVKEYGIKVVFFDYVQLMQISETSTDDTAELRFITRDLKSMANQLNIPIVILAQLSRSVETRGGDNRPILSDLKQSGSLEEDADTVIFWYRSAYYRKDVSLPKKEVGRTLMDVAKGRNIGTGVFDVYIDFEKYDAIDMSDFEE